MDNRRKTIVINNPFQYQHSLLVAALAILLINGFLILRMLFPGDDPLGMTTGQMTGLAVLELLLVAGIWYGCLKASHRIAGPVYVFAREIRRLGEGDLRAKVILRDKDMFRPEAEQINNSIAALRTRIATVKELSEQLQIAQHSGTDLNPIAEKLAIELEAFNIGNTH
jgi:methyl-accepting chemotaxis protein